MNSRIKYLTSATFLIILQILLLNGYYILSVFFGLVTVVYLLLEFNGMRPKYFLRTSVLVLLLCNITLQNQIMNSDFVLAHVQYLQELNAGTLINHVLEGLGILIRIL